MCTPRLDIGSRPNPRARHTFERVRRHPDGGFPVGSKGNVRSTLPLAVDLVVALALGALAALAALLYARSPATSNHPALGSAEAVGEAIRPHPWLRRTLSSRLDRSVASGLLLTLGLGVAIVAGLLLGLLAYLTRSLPATQRLDNAAAEWGFDHRTELSTRGLHLVTDLGEGQVVIALALVVLAFDFLRTRGRWCAPFLLAVMIGQKILTDSVKDLADRVRPAFDPAAAGLGPSFPSGHSATSAAFYAAAALVLTRYAQRPVRLVVIGVAVSIAVAVAASRVLLDYHWLSDVVGGLALGWGWFALCAVIFGGRLLRPTAAADVAASTATRDQPTATSRRSHQRRRRRISAVERADLGN
jgi:membrane-associated phospholipid phosphatase